MTLFGHDEWKGYTLSRPIFLRFIFIQEHFTDLVFLYDAILPYNINCVYVCLALIAYPVSLPSKVLLQQRMNHFFLFLNHSSRSSVSIIYEKGKPARRKYKMKTWLSKFKACCLAFSARKTFSGDKLAFPFGTINSPPINVKKKKRKNGKDLPEWPGSYNRDFIIN